MDYGGFFKAKNNMENYREPACLYDGQRRLYCEQRLLSDDRRIPSSRFGFFEFFTTYLV